MATLVKSFVFAADAEGLADAGNNANLTFAFDGTDGNPTGCVKFTTSTKSATMEEFGQKSTTTDTWQTWGIPSGATVTNAQISAWQKKLVSNTKLSSNSVKLNVIDASAAIVTASDLISASLATTTDASWQAQSAGSTIGVNAGSQNSTSAVRLKIDYTCTTSGTAGTANVDARFDQIDLTITYTPAPVSTFDANLLAGD